MGTHIVLFKPDGIQTSVMLRNGAKVDGDVHLGKKAYRITKIGEDGVVEAELKDEQEEVDPLTLKAQVEVLKHTLGHIVREKTVEEEYLRAIVTDKMARVGMEYDPKKVEEIFKEVSKILI